MPRPTFALVVLGPVLAACGSYHVSQTSPAAGTATAAAEMAAARPATDVVVTENDITNRRYRSLGDVKVTVRKVTIFDADPSRESVARSLREEAGRLGADAVVLARYGTVGIGFWSWGQMEGSGRAVRFVE